MYSLFKNLFIVSALLFFPTLYAHASATPIVCDQEYALCTSARCIPQPGSVTDAMCDCVVEKGNSVGYTSCEKRKARQDKYGVTSLVSTFSFTQFATKKPMNCTKGLPWSNCVDMPCTVDPQNAKRALCKCKVDNTHAFFTFGGACNTTTCASGFWSGATPEIGAVLREALMEKTHVKTMNMPAMCNAPVSSN